MWLPGERNLILESHPQIIKYWCSGLAARVGRQPKASVFDNLGMRLYNQLCFSKKSHFVTFKNLFADFFWAYHLGVTDESCSGSYINRQSNEMRFNRLERVSANAFWCYLTLEAARTVFITQLQYIRQMMCSFPVIHIGSQFGLWAGGLFIFIFSLTTLVFCAWLCGCTIDRFGVVIATEQCLNRCYQADFWNITSRAAQQRSDHFL